MKVLQTEVVTISEPVANLDRAPNRVRSRSHCPLDERPQLLSATKLDSWWCYPPRAVISEDLQYAGEILGSVGDDVQVFPNELFVLFSNLAGALLIGCGNPFLC